MRVLAFFILERCARACLVVGETQQQRMHARETRDLAAHVNPLVRRYAE